MRIVFGSTPVPGHVLPLLPLADAATAAGHDVAFLTARTMAPFLTGRTLLAAGAAFEQFAAEAATRTTVDTRHPGAGAAELFAGARVDLTWDAALTAARAFAPQLLVGEWVDYVTPLLAAELNVPWAAHSIGGPLPVAFTEPMADRSAEQHRKRGLAQRRRFALVDLFPIPLRGPADPAVDADRIEIRPIAHRERVPGLTVETPMTTRSDRPCVLVTTGTSVADPDLFQALAGSLVEAGADVLITAAPHPDLDRPHVHAIGFVPLADILPRVDVVLGTAGSGTLLATLAYGRPSILLPRIADQPANAARAAAHDAAIEITDPAQAGSALSTLLADDRYRTGPARLRTAIAAMPDPAQALTRLLDRMQSGVIA